MTAREHIITFIIKQSIKENRPITKEEILEDEEIVNILASSYIEFAKYHVDKFKQSIIDRISKEMTISGEVVLNGAFIRESYPKSNIK
jgi:hypothetical protein